jgi:hypothetical protein
MLPNNRFWRFVTEAIPLLLIAGIPGLLGIILTYNNFLTLYPPATTDHATVAALSADTASHGVTALFCVAPGSDDVHGTVLVTTSNQYINLHLPGDAGGTTSLGEFGGLVDPSTPSECFDTPEVRKAEAARLAREKITSPSSNTLDQLVNAKAHTGCPLAIEKYLNPDSQVCSDFSSCINQFSANPCGSPIACNQLSRSPCPSPIHCDPLESRCTSPTPCNRLTATCSPATPCNRLTSRCPSPAPCNRLTGSCTTPNVTQPSPSARPTTRPSPTPLPTAVSDAVAFGYTYTVPPSNDKIRWPFSFTWRGAQRLSYTERFFRLEFSNDAGACSSDIKPPCLHETLIYETPVVVRIYLPRNALPTSWPSDATFASGSVGGESVFVIRTGLADGSSLEIHWIDRDASSRSNLALLVIGVFLGALLGVFTSWLFERPRFAKGLQERFLQPRAETESNAAPASPPPSFVPPIPPGSRSPAGQTTTGRRKRKRKT